MIILNGNDETIKYDKHTDKLWVKEVFYDNKLIGINVMVNDDIIDTYSNEECSSVVVKYIFNSSEDTLDINDINFKLEVY